MVSDSARPEVPPGDGAVPLPEPRSAGAVALEDLLADRRSVRAFTDEPLAVDEVSQLLWAAQGVTHRDGFRTAPSAGALYPLEVYVAAGDVEGLSPGVYRYRPARHALQRRADGDRRNALARAALDQWWLADGAAVIVLAAVYERTTRKYGERGARYVHMEAGHAAQNVCLEAQALALGTAVVGAFHDDRVRDALELEAREEPLALLPVGRR